MNMDNLFIVVANIEKPEKFDDELFDIILARDLGGSDFVNPLSGMKVAVDREDVMDTKDFITFCKNLQFLLNNVKKKPSLSRSKYIITMKLCNRIIDYAKTIISGINSGNIIGKYFTLNVIKNISEIAELEEFDTETVYISGGKDSFFDGTEIVFQDPNIKYI